MSVGERLATLMAQAQLNDNDLARASGVPQSTISRIKNGDSKEPRDGTLRKLAKALGVSLLQLRGDVPTDQVLNVSAAELRLLADYRRLSPTRQQVIRETAAAYVKLEQSQE